MRLRNTIIVVVLLALVGGYALYVGHHPPPGKNHPPFTLAANDIASIELRTPSQDIVVERGKDRSWVLTKPTAASADQTAVESMAGAIANLEITDTVEENPADLAQFGLARPAVTVTVTTKDKRVLPAIEVGKQTPVGDSAYIRMSNRPAVLLVAASFPANVEKSVDDLRSRALIALKPAAINRIVITPASSGPEIELERKGENWMILKPERTAAEDAAVQQFLDTVTAGQVSEFVEDKPSDLAKYGLVSPSLRVALYGGKDNHEESLLFGFKLPEAEKNAIYVRRGEGSEQPIASVAEYVFSAANKTFDDLRDKTLLVFDRSSVERIAVAGGPPPAIVARAPGGKWSIAGEGKTANAEVLVAESLLDQIHDLQGTKIVEDPMTDPKRYGMERPSLEFTLYAKDGKQIGVIKASELEVTVGSGRGNGKPAPQHFGYATTSANQAVYQIMPERVSDLGRTVTRLEGDLAGKPTPTPAASASPEASPSPIAK
jgi:hypothetical protein